MDIQADRGQTAYSARLRSRLKLVTHSQRLTFIIALAVGLRILFALLLGDSTPPGKDETSYSELAWRLVNGHGLSFEQNWYPFTPANTPTAHWSFIYTGFIAGIYAVVGQHPLVVRMLTAVVTGILLPLATYHLAKRVVPSNSKAPYWAALGAAVYLYFGLFGARVQTEGLFLLAVVFTMERALALRGAWHAKTMPWQQIIGFGLALGLAGLLRQSILPWFVVLFGWLLLLSVVDGVLRRGFWSLFVAGCLLLIAILPFTLRNYLVYDGFLLLNSNSGYAMYAAQHPAHGTNFQAYFAAPLPEGTQLSDMNEAEWDSALLELGFGFIEADPTRYWQLSASRIADYFEFWPTADSSLLFNIGRILSFTLFIPLFLYGLWLSRKRWRSYQLLYGFAVFYSILHILTWAMTRYRLPVDAVMMVFAGLALEQIMQKKSGG